MNTILLCAVLVVGSQADPAARLTKIQISKIQQVVRHAQDQKDAITAKLGDRQQKLMEAYSQFSLDDKLIARLHTEIVDLQRQLLNNYRDLQVQLRDVVGRPGFLRLKQRIDLILKGKKKVQTTTEPGSANQTTSQRAISSGKSPTQ